MASVMGGGSDRRAHREANEHEVGGWLPANTFLSFEQVSCQGITSFKYLFLISHLVLVLLRKAVIATKLQFLLQFFKKLV